MANHSSILALSFPGSSVDQGTPAVQETWVQSLDQEDPLEKEMAILSNILAWKILWTELEGLQSLQELHPT